MNAQPYKHDKLLRSVLRLAVALMPPQFDDVASKPPKAKAKKKAKAKPALASQPQPQPETIA